MAENLVFYHVSNSGMVRYYYDADSIRRDGSTVLVWTHDDASKDYSEKYSISKRRLKFDCYNESWDLVSWVEYDRSGNVKNSNSSGGTGMEAIVPGSVGEVLFKIFCSR